MKKFISLILAAVIASALFAGCSPAEKKEEKMHTLYFKDSLKSKNVSAVFFNSDGSKKKKVKMKKISGDKNSFTFSCKGDTSVYNMAYILYDNKKSEEFAFNKCVSGWYNMKDNFAPYTQGEKINYFPKFEDVTLKGKICDKTIHIWKPDDYDSSSNEKYSTVYVLDAHIMTTFASEEKRIGGCPIVTEQVKAMNSAAGRKTIVVAIENIFARDNELVPKIGKSTDEKLSGKQEFENMNGSQFAKFVATTIVPYVQKHYNVYTDALHTSITGISLGGLESFYITMEYPKIFGTVGALSPSFWEFDSNTWTKYLKKKSFSDKSPFLYFYTGPEKSDTDPFVTNMYNRLYKMGYPKNKLALHFNKNGAHSGYHWRSVFSEFLNAMVYQSGKPLKDKFGKIKKEPLAPFDIQE